MGKNPWYGVNWGPDTKNEIHAPGVSTHAGFTRRFRLVNFYFFRKAASLRNSCWVPYPKRKLKSVSKCRDLGGFCILFDMYLGNDTELEAETFQKSPCTQMMKIARESRFLGFFADF